MKKILLVVGMTLSTTFLFSQDTNKVKKDTTISLKSVSVIGVKADAKTPISQKTISKTDIEKTYQGQEMTYTLSKTPSITYQSDGGQPNGYTTFRLRGIDQTRINMTLNGVPLNEPEDQGVYFSNYPDFAINIQSLQIQRGVGTSTNGVSSFGGSINFESQSGLEKGGEVQLGYGSFNTSHFNISNSTGLINNKFALFTSLSGYNSDGYKYHSDGQGYSAFISGGYYGKSNTIKFTAFTGRALNGMAWLAVSEDDINKDPRTNYNNSLEKDNFTQTFGQIEWVKTTSKNSFIKTTIFYNRLNGQYSQFVDESSPIDLDHYFLHSNFYGLISNYHLELTKFKFDAGVSGNIYDRNHIETQNGTIGELYNNVGHKDEFSSYLKGSYDIGKLTLFTDIQERSVSFNYNGDVSISKLYWNFINPKGGITFKQNDNISYYFSVGSSHREPTRTDMFGGNDNLITLGSTIPEQVTDYELGVNIKYQNLKIQSNLYYMNFHNEITLLGALGSNGLPLTTTLDKSYRSGLETDITYKLNKTISFINSSNISRNYFKGNAGQFQPLYTPTVVINQGIDISIRNLIFNITTRYQDKSYISLDNEYYTPSFIIFNSNIRYKIDRFTFLLQGNNLTNRKYFTNGYVIDGVKYYFVNAPISQYLTIKYSL